MVLALALNAVADTEGSDLTGDFQAGCGREAMQLQVFLVICVMAAENVELGSYLYFKPTDTFFW